MRNRSKCAQQVKYVGNTDVIYFGFYFMSPKWTRTKLVIEISLSLQAYLLNVCDSKRDKGQAPRACVQGEGLPILVSRD